MHITICWRTQYMHTLSIPFINIHITQLLAAFESRKLRQTTVLFRSIWGRMSSDMKYNQYMGMWNYDILIILQQSQTYLISLCLPVSVGHVSPAVSRPPLTDTGKFPSAVPVPDFQPYQFCCQIPKFPILVCFIFYSSITGENACLSSIYNFLSNQIKIFLQNTHLHMHIDPLPQHTLPSPPGILISACTPVHRHVKSTTVIVKFHIIHV